MMSVYKYPLSNFIEVYDLPRGAQFLSVQYQRNIPTLWAMVDVTAPLEKVKIICVGTGWTIPEGAWQYVSTIQDNNGYVWHYFREE